MLKMTISKIKKVCSVALIPRILRDDFTLTPKIIGKRPLNGFWKMNKSTDSKDTGAECEKCKKLIEMVFGPEKPEHILKQVEANLEDIHIDNSQKAVAPSVHATEKSNESCEQELLNPTDTDVVPVERDKKDLTILQSTTAKEEREELAQKLDTIQEPALVEAGTPKIEGFIHPRVLGNHETVIGSDLCTKIAPEEDAMDAIAKKCLSTPPDKIDDRIMEELKSCGMLGKGRRRPGPRKPGCRHRSHKKGLMKEKPDECMLYFQKQASEFSSLNTHPSLQYANVKLTQSNPDKIYSEYFKNVPAHFIKGKGDNTSKSDQKNVTALVSVDNRMNNTIVPVANKIHENEVGEIEIDKKNESLIAYEKQNLEPVETPEVEIEELRVTAAETSRCAIIGENNVVADERNPIKPESLPCKQVHGTTQAPLLDKTFEPDKRRSYAFSSETSDPPDWQIHLPNTAISGTFPVPDAEPEVESKDTAISSWQSPSEFYDVCHSDIQQLDAYAHINPTMRPLEAYHQYTVISTEEKECQSFLYTTKGLNPPSTPSDEKAEAMINKDISAATGPVPHLKDLEEELPLTEMLKRVRERNRLEYCKECECRILDMEPAEANKCNPPLDRSPPKPLGPGPCKKPTPPPPPKCPPPCPPPCPPKDPCKPKDPCAKCTKTSLLGDRIKEAFTLVLQIGLKPLPVLSFSTNLKAVEPLKQLFILEDSYKAEKPSTFLLSNGLDEKELDNEDVILARDFEPWTPIPSWPIPKKEKKEPFVCPKEGCKIIPPPQLNPPCKENPCANLPKRSFSGVEINYEPLYLYEDEF